MNKQERHKLNRILQSLDNIDDVFLEFTCLSYDLTEEEVKRCNYHYNKIVELIQELLNEPNISD